MCAWVQLCAGFWTALMYESGEEEAATLFDRLVSALKEGDDSRDIYLTGKLMLLLQRDNSA